MPSLHFSLLECILYVYLFVRDTPRISRGVQKRCCCYLDLKFSICVIDQETPVAFKFTNLHINDKNVTLSYLSNAYTLFI